MEAKHLERNQIDDEKWDAFIANSPQRTIYGHTWYLDIVCNEWEGIIVTDNREIIGLIPLNIRKKARITYTFQPKFAKYLGVFFKDFDLPNHKLFSIKKKIINLIIDNIPPKIKVFDMNFSKEFKYFPPFVWKGFTVKPQQTFFIDLEPSIEKIHQSFSSSLKRNIKSAIKNKITINTSSDIEPLIKLKLINNQYSNKTALIIRKIWDKVLELKLGKCIYAIKDGEIIGGCVIVVNYTTISGMFISSNKKYKNLNSSSLLYYERLKIAKQYQSAKKYDFEGSMIEPIESFMKKFNPEMATYYNISKNKIPLITKAYKMIK